MCVRSHRCCCQPLGLFDRSSRGLGRRDHEFDELPKAPSLVTVDDASRDRLDPVVSRRSEGVDLGEAGANEVEGSQRTDVVEVVFNLIAF